MKLTKATEADFPVLEKWLENENTRKLIQVEPPNMSLPSIVYMIRLDDDTPCRVRYPSITLTPNERTQMQGSLFQTKEGAVLVTLREEFLLRAAFSEDWPWSGKGSFESPPNEPHSPGWQNCLVSLKKAWREKSIYNGQREDVCIYGLLKSEFEGGSKGRSSSSCIN